jgi:hypothetical protein
MLAAQIFIGFDGPEFGGELLKLGSPLRHDHADRLVDLEPKGISLRVSFQLMLKLELAQSVSTMPSSGYTASFG